LAPVAVLVDVTAKLAPLEDLAAVQDALPSSTSTLGRKLRN
jgi:hypothetical protein